MWFRWCYRYLIILIMKKCIKCNKEKPLNEFSKNGFRNGLQTRRAQCKECYNSNWKYRLMSTLSGRIAKNQKMPDGRIKKTHMVDHNINGTFLESLKKEQNGMCYWLNIPIDFTIKDKLRKPSLDRLDNSKGYEIGNVVLTTVFANTGRRDATIKEMKGFVDSYLQRLYMSRFNGCIYDVEFKPKQRCVNS